MEILVNWILYNLITKYAIESLKPLELFYLLPFMFIMLFLFLACVKG